MISSQEAHNFDLLLIWRLGYPYVQLEFQGGSGPSRVVGLPFYGFKD